MKVTKLQVKILGEKQYGFNEDFFNQTLKNSLESLVELDITLHYNWVEMTAERYVEIKGSKEQYTTIELVRQHISLLKIYHFDISCLADIFETISFEGDFNISFETLFGNYSFTLKKLVKKLKFLQKSILRLIVGSKPNKDGKYRNTKFNTNPSYYVIKHNPKLLMNCRIHKN